MEIRLYTDGASRGNPGPAGIGVVLQDAQGRMLRRFGRALQQPVTGNVAEYCAAIAGLREARRIGATRVVLHSDSELLVRQLQGRYAVSAEHLRGLYAEAVSLIQRFERVELVHVPREANTTAHALAELAATRNRHWKHHTEEGSAQMKLTVTANEVIPADVYEVILRAVEEHDGLYGRQLRWRLEVCAGEHAGARLTAWTNCTGAIQGKAYRWYTVFSGKPVPKGGELDFDAILGHVARAVVDVHTTSDGRRVNKVTNLLPPKQPVAVSADDDDPFEDAEDEEEGYG